MEKDPKVLGLRAISLFTKATVADDARLPRAFLFFLLLYLKKKTDINFLLLVFPIFLFVSCTVEKKPSPSAADVIKPLITTFFLSFTTFTEIK